MFSWECDILSHLLQAQILMAEWQFLPSLLQLHAAHSKLQTWLTAAAVKEVSAVLGAEWCPKTGCRTVPQDWVQNGAPRLDARQCPKTGWRTVPQDWMQNCALRLGAEPAPRLGAEQCPKTKCRTAPRLDAEQCPKTGYRTVP